jgi:hypothetical protein
MPTRDDTCELGRCTVPHPFLSDEWLAEVRRVLEEGAVDVPAGTDLRMNLVVTDTPFGADRELHVVTADGRAEWDLGHVERPDLTITTDYTTARELFIGADLQAALAALTEGRLKLQGDLTKLMAAQMAGTGPGSPGLARALAEITA